MFAPDGSPPTLSHGDDLAALGMVVAPYADRFYGGAEGNTHIVFQIDADVSIDDYIWIDVQNDLAVPIGVADYSASISAHETAEEADSGEFPTGTFGGSAVIANTVAGIDAKVSPGPVRVANVASGFLWFLNPNVQTRVATPNVNMVTLGNAKALTKGTDDGVLSAVSGQAPGDLIGEGGVNITVEGDFSIGAFAITRDDPGTADTVENTNCPAPGTEDTPAMGNLVPSEEEPNMVTINTAAVDGNSANILGGTTGTYTLCVQVDLEGVGPDGPDGGNTPPLPATTYMGTISLPPAMPGGSPTMLDSGVIGRIARNGTTVELTYLTTSDKYNQRLIIVNRGSADVTYDFVSFESEEGKMVELTQLADAEKAAGHNVVKANSQVVLPIGRILSITGTGTSVLGGDAPRTAATLSLNADSSMVQVATTQVNRDDGSTDTVLYASEGGVEVEVSN